MGNKCHKTSKVKKNLKKPNDSNILAQPPSLKNSGIPDNKKNNENLKDSINLTSERDPQKIFTILISSNLTDTLKTDTNFNTTNYLSKLNELDIDIIVSVIKKFSNSDISNEMKSEKIKKLSKEFKDFKENVNEYQSKYLSLQPKDSKDFAMKIIKLYMESYHLFKIHQNNENDEKSHYKTWNNSHIISFENDYEYLKEQYNEIENEIQKYFKGIIKSQINLEIYQNVTNVFINEIFSYALTKFNEENFVESWGFDHQGKFGKEWDHKALKCFDYKFEIHMMNH